MAQNPVSGRRRVPPPPAAALGAEALKTELHRIGLLSIEELRTLWRTTLLGSPPPTLSRDMLARMIAYRIQEDKCGALDADTRKLLTRLAQGDRVPVRHLKIGSIIVREHQGTLHEVTVVPGGFQWQGSIHSSLSTIARAITGTAWNGPRFFGLRGKPTVGIAEEAHVRADESPIQRMARGSIRPSRTAAGQSTTSSGSSAVIRSAAGDHR
jgi:hypothetical protein